MIDPNQTILFTRGNPAPESLPVADLSDCAASIFASEGQVVFQYGHYSGYKPLRAWIADWYSVDIEQVLIGNSSMEFFTFGAALLVEKGDAVFLENPSYDRAITAMKRAGAEVIGVPLEPDGVDLAHMEKALEKRIPKLFYIVPEFQNPSGVTTSLEKRKAIAELSDRYGFMIMEDAPYRPLRYHGQDVPSFRELVPDKTLHVCSFSKIVSPGLRVGFLIGPKDVMPKFHKWSEDTYIHPSLVTEGIVYEYCRRGLLEPNIESLKEMYRPRLDCITEALEKHLPDSKWFRTEGGFFLSLWLPPEVDGNLLREKAGDFGISLSDGRGFFTDDSGDNFVRLPFCGITPEEINEGTVRLAKAIDRCRD